VEYALILAFVVAIAIVALKSDSGIGQSIQNLFSNTGNKIENAGGSIGGNSGGSTTNGG
jgi:pilus assembly protein Flp/PilA